jgi:trans-aconitate 2-methyltransferase
MTVCKIAKLHHWNPEKYNDNSSIQYIAAMELLKKHQMIGTESVLDVGCGDGKITAEISKQVPLGKVYGIDISSDMIRFAKEHFLIERYSNLTFGIEDANKLDYNENFDIIFSSFALQWIEDHKNFIKRSLKCLRLNGYILFTIPLGVSEELETTLKTLLKRERWCKFFPDQYKPIKLLNDLEWKKVVGNFQLELVHFDKVNQNTFFPSFSCLKRYITQWLPHTYVLPEELRPEFKRELFRLYSNLMCQKETSEVCFSFPRLDIVGRKIGSVLKMYGKKVKRNNTRSK